jgi:hypothetical protein
MANTLKPKFRYLFVLNKFNIPSDKFILKDLTEVMPSVKTSDNTRV